MRKLFIVSTTIFWLAVAGFWLAGKFHTGEKRDVTVTVTVPDLPHYSLGDVSRHNRENDCWMVIDEKVYDLSAYLPAHPSDPAIVLPWCGKEASHAWQTKTIARPHSSRAKHLLERYLKGKLSAAP